MAATTSVLNQNQNILYVVLHGLISLVDANHDGFIANLLEIGNVHKYMYGNWLLEQDIPKRHPGQLPMSAQLVGVNPGNEELDPSLNVIIKVPVPPLDTNPIVRATFLLPRPQTIYYFISGELAPNTLQGKDLANLVAPPSRISGIRVFEYAFSDPNGVALIAGDKTRLWACPKPVPLAPLADRNVAVLHVYDEPLQTLTGDEVTQHNLDEFNLSLKFFATSLTLTKTVQAINAAQATIPGLLPGETAALDQRSDFVFAMLQNVRNPSLSPTSPPGGGGFGGQICSGVHAVVAG